jgi:hypothetical protein
VGVCDENCIDLDLKLYDQNGNIIDYDTGEDNTPLVTVTPDRPRGFKIKVEMSTCNVSSCDYGVGIFPRSL